MQTAPNILRTARRIRLAAALCSALVSATLLGSVVFAFDHQARHADPVAQTSAVRIG